ncbi:MAG: tripartite tricarboxylate transporter TctB family protein [Burkholderiales bacterium]
MHNKSSLILAAGIVLVSGYAVVTAWGWPVKAALFPLVIGIPLFCLAAAEALWVLLGRPEAKGEAAEFRLSTDRPAKETLRRTLLAAGWILGFLAAIVLLGFPIAVPLFMLLYLRLQGEGWVLTLAMSAAVWGIFYGLFDRLLHLPFPAGWIFSWL